MEIRKQKNTTHKDISYSHYYGSYIKFNLLGISVSIFINISDLPEEILLSRHCFCPECNIMGVSHRSLRLWQPYHG